MAVVRFRAQLRYNVGSGYAQWLWDQMQVRLGQAFHLNPGTPEEEQTYCIRDIVSSGPQSGRKENITMDVFWPGDREDLAIDTRNTIESTYPWVRTDEPDDGEKSWVDYHYCNHDGTGPCSVIEYRWP